MDIKKILPLFSYIFHPIFISVYATLFYFLVSVENINVKIFYLTLIQVCILTVLLPLSLYFLLLSLGYIKSFTEASIKERKFPIAIQTVLLLILLKYCSFLELYPALFLFFIGGILSALIALLLAIFKFKASLHMIGICSLVSFIYFVVSKQELVYTNTLAMTVIFIGLVGSSRLYMKSHTNIELAVGCFIGIVTQIIAIQFWL
jgi:hypothetical protein